MTNDEAVRILHEESCAYCSWGASSTDNCDNDDCDVKAALTLAIAALERDRWISVEERLPEGREYVLCCGSKGGQFVGWVAQSVRQKKAYAFQYGRNWRRITHWRQLPEPPKEET